MKTFYKPSLEVADIFRQFGHLLPSLPAQHKKVITALLNCRTAALGGHRQKCESCEFEKNSYNSCRNRHCPKCQFLARAKWIEKREEDLLDCQYFHVVFTVPSELKPLILANKKISYDILFRAAAETLKEVAENPRHLGAEIGAIGVLHTWGQNLTDHPHIHFIVPGGGLNAQKTRWIPCRKDYLLPIEVLSKVFRGKFLGFIEEAYAADKFTFVGGIAPLSSPLLFKDLMVTAAGKEFITYAKESFQGPQQVINYLGQYTHRIAISNYRLVKLEGETVHFKVRDREDPGKKKVTKLHVKEFMRRFLLHVLPHGYVRIRHFGLLSSRLKKKKIAIVRTLTGMVEKVKAAASETWRQALVRLTGIDVELCPRCRKKSMLHLPLRCANSS